ncbi:MAG: YlbF family regulator [Clostridia bacterium]|nr:YlbF family regulator [Clostridia bacterium]
MNFYDKVHEMIRTLKDTEEYKEFISAKSAVKKDEGLSAKITAFRETQRQEQMKYIKGQPMDDQSKAKLSSMYAEIIKEELGVRYFQAEIKLDVMLADMQKIISEGIQEAVEF